MLVFLSGLLLLLLARAGNLILGVEALEEKEEMAEAGVSLGVIFSSGFFFFLTGPGVRNTGDWASSSVVFLWAGLWLAAGPGVMNSGIGD